MMKRGLYTAIGLVLIAIGCVALYNMLNEKPEEDFRHEWRFEAGELRDLAIEGDSRGLNVKYEASGDGTESVSIEGRADGDVVDRIKQAKLRDGRLAIDTDPESFRIGIFDWGDWNSINDRFTITVKLADPDALEKLEVESDSGGVQIEGLSASSASVSTESGSIRMYDFKGERLEVEADSGSIRGERIEADLAVAAQSGSVKLQDVKGERLTAKSDSGSIQAERIEAELEVSSDSGSIQFQGLTGKSAISSDSGSVRLDKLDDSDADIKTESGSVKIDLPASFAGFYDLQSDSGSIRAPESKRETNGYIKVRTDSGSIRVDEK